MEHNKNATSKLNDLERITFEQLDESYESDVLLYDKNEKLYYKNDKVYQQENTNLKDLLRIIRIIDPLNLQFEYTNILVPRVYAEKHTPIPQHISVQSLFFHSLSKDNVEELKNTILTTKYNKTSYDDMWVGYEKSPSAIKENDLIYLMNRRVGGWDGSIERPVIELLCSGGHLPTVWNEQVESFETLNPIDLFVREVKEELGIAIPTEKIIKLGGFHNTASNELVILCALFVDYNQLKEIIKYSKTNISENIDGIYMGFFEDVMKLYDSNPNFFAGGEKAKASNFPSNYKLMKKIKSTINNIKTN